MKWTLYDESEENDSGKSLHIKWLPNLVQLGVVVHGLF